MIMYMATSRANNSKAYNGGYEVVLATRSSICLNCFGYVSFQQNFHYYGRAVCTGPFGALCF